MFNCGLLHNLLAWNPLLPPPTPLSPFPGVPKPERFQFNFSNASKHLFSCKGEGEGEEEDFVGWLYCVRVALWSNSFVCGFWNTFIFSPKLHLWLQWSCFFHFSGSLKVSVLPYCLLPPLSLSAFSWLLFYPFPLSLILWI